ncbi:HAD family hydrolase [Lactococcus lactis]|uniref:HAD family hydrolase n=1 Tax=Lactococcus lactis TaxID=1358 RepID=UPI0018C81F55|nr:HAD family hydrolase [Lactococcus lactis]
MPNNDIKAVIFDWDNTLFPFKTYWEKSHNKVFYQNHFEDLGLDYQNFITTYRYYDKMLWKEVLLKKITLGELRQQRLIMTMRDYGIEYSSNRAQKFFEDFFNQLLKEIVPENNLILAVKELKEEYNLSILTNGKIFEQTEKIKRSGFEGVLDTYISDQIGYEKPDIRAFQYVIKQQGLEPQTTLMVGDSYDNDLKPAHELGMKTAYIGNTSSLKTDYSFNTIMELVAFLKRGLE